MSKKERLAHLVMKSWVENLLVNRSKRHLSVLAYHSIQSYQHDYPYNAENISAYPEIFARQMEFIKKHFHVINFHKLKNMQEELKTQNFSTLLEQLPANTIIITFDDGYADNCLTALPILQHYDLTAVVYISTDFVDQQKRFWFDEVAECIRTRENGPLNIMGGRFATTLSEINREQERRAFGRFLQTLSDSDRISAIDELKLLCDYAETHSALAAAMPLSWSQVKTLRTAGIEIGSHSLNHGFLDMMNDKELELQISGSKAHIEKQLGEKIISFSYPNGNFHQGVVNVVRRAGYDFAVNYKHDIARVRKTERFLIPRIHVETDFSSALFKANLLLPSIFVR